MTGVLYLEVPVALLQCKTLVVSVKFLFSCSQGELCLVVLPECVWSTQHIRTHPGSR